MEHSSVVYCQVNCSCTSERFSHQNKLLIVLRFHLKEFCYGVNILLDLKLIRLLPIAYSKSSVIKCNYVNTQVFASIIHEIKLAGYVNASAMHEKHQSFVLSFFFLDKISPYLHSFINFKLKVFKIKFSFSFNLSHHLRWVGVIHHLFFRLFVSIHKGILITPVQNHRAYKKQKEDEQNRTQHN